MRCSREVGSESGGEAARPPTQPQGPLISLDGSQNLCREHQPPQQVLSHFQALLHQGALRL